MDDAAAKPVTAKKGAPGVSVATSAAAKPAAAKAVTAKPLAVKPPLAAAPAAVKTPAAVAKPPVAAATAKPEVKKPVTAEHKPAPAQAAKPVPAALPVHAAEPVATPAPQPVVHAEPVAQPDPIVTPAIIAPTSATTAEKDVIMDTIKTITDKAQAMFSTDHAKGAMEKGQKMFDEMNSFSKGNIEAMVESSKIAAKGMEAFGHDAAAYAKKSFDEASAAVKTMASVKSPTEFMKLQSDYVRSAFDMMVAETSRSTEAMLKLAGEVAQPISNRVAIAAEKVKIAA